MRGCHVIAWSLLIVFSAHWLPPCNAWAKVPCGCVCSCPDPPGGSSRQRQGRWFVVESQNFQACCDVSETRAGDLVRHAEALRRSLQSKWLVTPTQESWNPRCQLVLHRDRQAYLRAVGRGGERTAGSSSVDVLDGRVTRRRIDLLGGDGFLTAALPHELTHVVLRDRFPEAQLPTWADEGMAILADSVAKQERHRRDLDEALHLGTPLRVVTLLSLADYPRADLFGAFYGQSIALTEFLISRKTPQWFVEFIECASRRGYDAALREYYDIDGVAALERCCQRHIDASMLTSRHGRRRSHSST